MHCTYFISLTIQTGNVPSWFGGSIRQARQQYHFLARTQQMQGITPACLEESILERLIRGIDNHDSGYLGMAVQLCVQAHLGHYHILTPKEYSQKLMAQLKSTPLFTPICII